MVIEISDLTVRLLFLFLPGIIGTLIIDLLTTHRKRQSFQFLLHAYLLGMASYFVLGLAIFLIENIVFFINKTSDYINLTFTWKVTFLDSLLDSDVEISLKEVFFSSLISIALSVFIVIFINNKCLYKIARKYNISSKGGDDDIWDYLFGSNQVEWVSIRDLENDLIYQGAIRAFSEKDDKRELYLSDVIVFDGKNGDELYTMDDVYFNFDINSNIVVEIHGKEESRNER